MDPGAARQPHRRLRLVLALGARAPGKSNNYTAPALASSAAWRPNVGHYRRALPRPRPGQPHRAACNLARMHVQVVPRGYRPARRRPSRLAAANAKAAFGWYAELQQRGFHPLLLDSNGRGGYHLLVVFAEPCSFTTGPCLRHAVRAGLRRTGLAQAPEVFPKQPDVNEQRRYGNWARLPGRHHTRDHWTKVWDGTQWLEDQAAVEAILSVTGDSPELIPRYVQ